MAAGDAKAFPVKNTAYRVTFPILDADGDLVTGAASLDSEVSIDGGTFADCTNEATEIATSSGVYYLDLTAGEMNGDTIAVIVKTGTAGAKTTTLIFYPIVLTAAVLGVDTIKVGGTTQTGRDIGASVLLSPGTGTGQLSITSGVVSADATKIGGVSAQNPDGPIPILGIVAAGTTQSGGSDTTAVLPNTFDLADDVVLGSTIYFHSGGAYGFSRSVTDYVFNASTPTVTFDTIGGGLDTNADGFILWATAPADQTNLPDVHVASIAADAITATAIQNDAFTAAKFAADVATEMQNGIATSSVVNAIKTKTDYLPSATAGAAGGVFIAGSNAATTVNITGNITGNVSGSVGSVTGAVGSVTGNVGGNVSGSVGSVTGNVGGNVTGSVGSVAANGITNSSLATTAVDEIVAGVLDVDASTHNNAGSIGAKINSAAAAGDPMQATVPGTYTAGQAGYVIGTYLNAAVNSLATASALSTMQGNVTDILGDIGELQTDWVNGGRLDLLLDAIKGKTDSLPAVPAAVGSAMTLTSGERDAIATAHLDLSNGVETGLTVRNAHRLEVAAAAAKISGAGTTSVQIRNAVADTKTRISATVDASSNRTAITYDLTD